MNDVDPAIENERLLARRRTLREEATRRHREQPCPDACGHTHLTREQIEHYGLWDELLAGPAPLLVPPPEISSRDPHHFAVPKTARALAQLAAANRWRVRLTYARGPRIHSTTGKVTRVVDTVAVRARRDDQTVLAFWTAGAFEAPAVAWTFGKPPELLGAEPIKAHVRNAIATKETDQ